MSLPVRAAGLPLILLAAAFVPACVSDDSSSAPAPQARRGVAAERAPTAPQSRTPALTPAPTPRPRPAAAKQSPPRSAAASTPPRGPARSLTFTTNASITVTSLGFYDDPEDGLTASHPVGVYDQATQTCSRKRRSIPPRRSPATSATRRSHRPSRSRRGRRASIMAWVGAENYLAFNQIDPGGPRRPRDHLWQRRRRLREPRGNELLTEARHQPHERRLRARLRAHLAVDRRRRPRSESSPESLHR